MQNQSGTLKFQNEDHVLQVYNALCSLYEARADYLRDLALGMDSIELADILEDYEAASSMFNGNLPLEEFETALSFQSLRAQLAADDEAFLDQEEIDLDNLPSGQIPIQIPAMLALLDPQGKIIVGEQVVNVLQDVQDDIDEQYKSNCIRYPLGQPFFHTSSVKIRRDAGIARFAPPFNMTKAYSRIRLYEKKPLRWKPLIAYMGADWAGPLMNSGCNQVQNRTPAIITTSTGYNRFTSDFVHTDRWNWAHYSANLQTGNKTIFIAYWSYDRNWINYNGPYQLEY